MRRPLKPVAPEGPWAHIDAARRAWETQRRKLDDQLIEAGVRARYSKAHGRIPITTIDERGTLTVNLGCGVKITGRDAETLLAGVAAGLEELKAERKRRKARREELNDARAAKAARIESRRRESVGGRRMSPSELASYAKTMREAMR